MLTRAQVAARLGISLAEVKRRERVGLIHPATMNEKGWHLYSVDQLEEIRNCTSAASRQKRFDGRDGAPYSGEEAARVFAALDRGAPLKECVTEFTLHPRIVEAIAEAWARLGGALFVSGRVMREVNELPLNGTFPVTSDTALLEILREAAADVCARCKRRARVLCRKCALHVRESAADTT